MPISVNVNVQPPFTPYLTDYYSIASDKFGVGIVLNDMNEQSWDIKLRISIESSSIKLETNSKYVPPPIILSPAVTENITGWDIAHYFDCSNLTITGLSRDEFVRNAILPEDLYVFSVQVMDYTSGRVLSNKASFSCYISMFDEPKIIAPRDGVVLKSSMVESLLFRWQHVVSVFPSSEIQYSLNMYELEDLSVEPLNALHSGKVRQIFASEPLYGTSYLLNVLDISFQKGCCYIFTISANGENSNSLFKNNGVSIPGFFYFGYPENGSIQIKQPNDGKTFLKSDQQFFSCEAPDNLVDNQGVNYSLLIVKSDSLYGKDVFDENIIWYKNISSTTYRKDGWSFMVDKNFEPQTTYEWQVKAWSEEQEIAKSEILSFSGPPLIDFFYAGDHKVLVSEISDSDLNALCGKGLVRLSSEDSLFEISFSDIKIINSYGTNILIEGSLKAKLTSISPIELEPDNKENNIALFFPDSVRLNKTQLAIKGHVEWVFPHPVNTSEKAIVKTRDSWVDFNKLKINGACELYHNESFDLLEPLNFSVYLDSDSDFLISDNHYRLRFNGGVTFPESVRSSDGKSIKIPFFEIEQLFYLNFTDLSITNSLAPINNTNVFIEAIDIVVDFSERQTPLGYQVEPEWKGAVINRYKLKFEDFVDQKKQLLLMSSYEEEWVFDSTYSNRCIVNSLGLQLNSSCDFSKNTVSLFNAFPSSLTNWNINIKDNRVEQGEVSGELKFPIISEEMDFSFAIDIDDNGLLPGYLRNDLKDYSFIFNSNNREQKLEITIRRAVFVNKERLEMNVDIKWPHLNVEMKNISCFSLWGNYKIGIGMPGKLHSLETQVATSLDGFPMMIDYLACDARQGVYAFGASATVVMADDISGEKGAPRINLYSVCENDMLPDDSIAVNSNTNNSSNTGEVLSSEETQYLLDSLNGMSENYDSLETYFSELLFSMEVLSDEELDVLLSSMQKGVDSSFYDGFSGIQNNSYSSNASLSSFDLSDFLHLIKKFLPENEKVFVSEIEIFVNSLSEKQKVLIINDFEEVLKLLAEAQVKKVFDILEEIINGKRDSLNGVIQTKINEVVVQVNGEISVIVDGVFQTIKEKLLDGLQNELLDVEPILNELIASAANNTKEEIEQAVILSVNKNVAEPITEGIVNRLAININEYVKKEIEAVGYAIIEGACGEKISNDIFSEWKNLSSELLNGIDVTGLKKGVLNLGNTFVAEVDFNTIGRRILNDFKKETDYLLGDLKNELEKKVNDINNNSLSSIVTGGGTDMELSFNNVYSKIIGDSMGLEGIAMDPVYINVDTRVVAFNGMVAFTSDDDFEGKIWRGELEFHVKVPVNVAFQGVFVNGTHEDYSFWYCDVRPLCNACTVVKGKAGPMENPVKMGPVELVGFAGRLFHHMSEDNTRLIPDGETKYGAALNVVLFDKNSHGSTFRIEAEASVTTSTNNDYVVDFYAGFQGGNSNPSILEVDEGAMIQGELMFNYNSSEKHFIGGGSAKIQKPALCAEGCIELDVRPGAWMVSVGKPEQRIIFVPGCSGFSPTGWLTINNSIVDLGLGLQFSGYAESPWIDILAYRVKPWAGFSLAAGIQAVVQYRPVVKIKEAGIWAEAYAGIGAKYVNSVTKKEGNWTLAEAEIAGQLKMIFDPKPVIAKGELSGMVSILGINTGFELEFEANM